MISAKALYFCFFCIFSILIVCQKAGCEPITVTHRTSISSGTFNPSLSPPSKLVTERHIVPEQCVITNADEDSTPSYSHYSHYAIWIALLAYVIIEWRHFKPENIIKQINLARSTNDYSTVYALLSCSKDHIPEVEQREIEGWLSQFMTIQSPASSSRASNEKSNESSISKCIGYLGSLDPLTPQGSQKLMEWCAQHCETVSPVQSIQPLAITCAGPSVGMCSPTESPIKSPTIEEETAHTVGTSETHHPRDLLSHSAVRIQTELENMNKINLISIHQRHVEHQLELSARTRELQVLREALQYEKMEKRRRKIVKAQTRKENKMWTGLVVIVSVLQFFIPLGIRISTSPPRDGVCLLPPMKLGPLTLIEEKSMCITLPSQIYLSIVSWLAFVFCRFFDLKAPQPILILVAMWCTDFHLVMASVILQCAWIILLWLLFRVYRIVLFERFGTVSSACVTLSIASAYYLHSFIYSLVGSLA